MSMAETTTGAAFDAPRHFRRKRIYALALPVVILAYFVYIFFAFDIPGLAERARMDNARILIADSFSHKTHVTRDNRGGGITIAVEGEAKGTWPEGRNPAWVTRDGADAARVTLSEDHVVMIDGPIMRYDVPGYGLIETEAGRAGVRLSLPTDEVPDWISASDARVEITTGAGRVVITRARTEVMRYEFGWELFWFTLDSPFHGKSFGDLVGLAVSGERVVADRSNLSAIGDMATCSGRFSRPSSWPF
jgi:phosphonate transport system permease protein